MAHIHFWKKQKVRRNSLFFLKVFENSEYDQEIPQSQTAEKPITLHRNGKIRWTVIISNPDKYILQNIHDSKLLV